MPSSHERTHAAAFSAPLPGSASITRGIRERSTPNHPLAFGIAVPNAVSTATSAPCHRSRPDFLYSSVARPHRFRHLFRHLYVPDTGRLRGGTLSGATSNHLDNIVEYCARRGTKTSSISPLSLKTVAPRASFDGGVPAVPREKQTKKSCSLGWDGRGKPTAPFHNNQGSSIRSPPRAPPCPPYATSAT